MNKYVDFFANLCQQDYQFQRYRPSHIAAAAVLAARRALCIKCVFCFLFCGVVRYQPVVCVFARSRKLRSCSCYVFAVAGGVPATRIVIVTLSVAFTATVAISAVLVLLGIGGVASTATPMYRLFSH